MGTPIYDQALAALLARPNTPRWPIAAAAST
jgi:hypothetical protein